MLRLQNFSQMLKNLLIFPSCSYFWRLIGPRSGVRRWGPGQNLVGAVVDDLNVLPGVAVAAQRLKIFCQVAAPSDNGTA